MHVYTHTRMYTHACTHTHTCTHMEDVDTDTDDEPDVQVENTYYQAKGLKEDEPGEALSTFATVSHVLVTLLVGVVGDM